MAFSVVEFGLPACGFSLWRVPLSLTPVALQLCSLPYSPHLYLRPYAYGTPRKGELCFVCLWQGFLVFLFSFVLLGIWLLIFHQSPSDLICLLQAFGFLGFYVLDLFVLFFFFFLP